MLQRHVVRAALLLAPMLVSAAENRVVDRVDASRRTVVRGNRHPQARPQNDLGAADPARELSYATVLLRPAASLELFLREQQDPKSPNYHRWLTPEQFADRFGLSAVDTDQVVAWLRSEGLQVHDVARGRHWITFSGRLDRVGRALGTRFRRYRVNGEEHIANADEPSVPEALTGVIAGFDGLDDFAARPMHVLADTAQYNSSSGSHYLAPDDFATIYNVKPLYDAGIDGTGVGIAVIGRTAIDLSDIQSFRSRHKLPPNEPKLVLIGADPGKTSDMIEADLDIEWAGAVARNATIFYVYARSISTSLQYAIDQNVAPIMTYSYGSCETASNNAMRFLAQQANAQGITFLAASGDDASAVCDGFYAVTPQAAKGVTLSFPANVPEVTAVGGTQFNEGNGTYWAAANDANGASALSYIPETVWNEIDARNALVASTGGASSFFSKPWWQTGPGVPDDKARDVPDVSLSAGALRDPYLVVSAGALRGVGGTSAGSPAFAGVVALLNHYLVAQGALSQPGLGNINPAMYRLAQAAPDVFHDIVDGDNKALCVQSSPSCVDGRLGYAAGPGYDMATGLGTIDAYNFVTKWNNGTASTTVLTASPEKADAGAPVKLTAAVSGSGQVAPTGTVTFLVNDLAVGSAPLVSAAGVAGASITAPAGALAGTVTAFYSGDGVYGGSSGTASVGLIMPASGSLVIASITPNPAPRALAGYWPFTITLSEKAGVATTVTGLVIAGQDNSSLIRLFNNGTIPARGTVAASLSASPPDDPVPGDVLFVISGRDADGRKWSQELTVTFTASSGPMLAPAITLSSTPSVAQRNLSAGPSCQWSQELTLDEHGGYFVLLTKLTIGGVDMTGQIQPLFGTTRLAPYGVLRAPICWDQTTAAPSTKTYTITGSADDGQTVTASATVSFQPPAASAVELSISPQSFVLTAADNKHEASGAIDIGVNRTATAWKASVTPANATTAWLKLARISGSGDGQIAFRAATADLSNGVYRAAIAVETPGAVPDHFTIPVTLVVGTSDATIRGVANSASFAEAFAPGMLMSVFGDGLVSATAQAKSIPLPLTLGGITATVNGVAAPILGTYADAGQINLQVPYEAGAGASVLAINNGGRISYYPFNLSVAAPGLFGLWDLSGKPVTSVKPGQTVVAWITGEGDTTPFVPTGNSAAVGTAASRLPKARQPLTVTIGGASADVLFSGVPAGVVGATQINLTVPPTVAAGAQPVVVTVGGAQSQAVTVNVTAQ